MRFKEYPKVRSDTEQRAGSIKILYNLQCRSGVDIYGCEISGCPNPVGIETKQWLGN